MVANRWLALVAVLALLIAVLLSPGHALAQAAGEQPTVYALLLYSPSCPHCHEFIQSSYPQMHEEFGDQFQLLFIDVSSQQGRGLAQAAYEVYGVPSDQRYVPMMLIGDEVLVGGVEIPERGSEIIREALQADGIPLPQVPGLQEAYQAAVAQAEGQARPESAGVVPSSAEPVLASEELEGVGAIAARLRRDPLANTLAIGVLLGLTASLGAVVVAGTRRSSERRARPQSSWLTGRSHWMVTLIVALAALGVAGTVVVQAAESSLALLLALTMGLLLLAAVVVVAMYRARALPIWLIPLVALAGLAAAIYLAYVEVGAQPAVCGVVGDCNTVQQSRYASLFGLIPIGVVGIAGYTAIVVAWILTGLPSARLSDGARVALLALVLFGVGFSIYLTFLEPFVIGATCAWCLTSALVMLFLLWLVAPSGWAAYRRLRAR